MQKNEIRDWKEDPVTKVFFNSLAKRRAAILEMIATGRPFRHETGETELKEGIGAVKLIDEIISASLIQDEQVEESL